MQPAIPSRTSDRDTFDSTGDAQAVLAARSEAVDAAVLSAWNETLAPAYPSGLCLIASGGFGRRELFPHSDVDLLLLVDSEPRTKDAREALSAFLRTLWDAGLRISHSVRSLPDCCEIQDGNIELTISLLDQRLLAGDQSLYRQLEERLPRFIRSQRDAISRHLFRLARGRHAKYQDTIHHLEPNVKETPGGLRDLHLVQWFRQVNTIGSIGVDADIAEGWTEALREARDFLFTLRCFLHYRAGRDNNLLSFDAQEEAAAQPYSQAKDAAEWMRLYFRHARQIHRAALRSIERAEGSGGNLLTSFRDWRSRLSNSEFTVSKERIYFKSPQQLGQDPELALRLFQFVARHGVKLSLDAERRIEERLPGLTAWFAEPRPVWRPLSELLCLPHAAMALEAMSECGLLRAIFPEWSRIECLVVRDFYHRYTVDEHSLVSIRLVKELASMKDEAQARFAELAAELDNPAILLFTLLFHDTGKGGGEGRHVAESRALAARALERIGAPERDRESVLLLIDLHLDLSSVMNSRDLDDPATARFLTERIGTVELLKQLTLLTYADIGAVNPGAMTPWRLDLLWRAYVVTHAELTRELDTERIQSPDADLPDAAGFLEGLPKRYLLTHSKDEIATHVELDRRCRETGIAIDLVRLNGFYRLTVVTSDRPGLLASIAGSLAGFGMNIVKAEAFANRRGHIVDTFSFSDPSRTLDLNPSEIDRLRVTLERVILGRLDARQLLQNRQKPPRPSRGARIRPRVAFNSDASGTATLIEIVAEDRPGLLYDLASTIASEDCNIEVVLVDTEAHRALDVFYVTRNGAKIDAGSQVALKDRLLAACGS